MTTAYPGAVDTFTRPGATTWTDGTTRTDGVNPDGAADPDLYGDAVEDNQYDAIEAIEAKVGTGASEPAAGTALRGTGAGTSAWEIPEVEVFWDDGDDTAKIAGEVTITDALADTSTTFTRSIVRNTAPPGYPNDLTTNVLRIECPAGVTGGNDRRWYPIVGTEDCTDGRIRALLFSRQDATQCGVFGRQSIRPSTTHPWGYIAWHDVAFQVESIVNVNTWENDVEINNMIQGSGGNINLPGLQRWLPITSSSKFGTTVTLTVPYGHGTVVGDSLHVTTQEIGGGMSGTQDYIVIVTEVGEQYVQYTSGTAATSHIHNGGKGHYMNRSIFPYFLELEVVGDTARSRAWRLGDATPDWSTVANSIRWDNTDSPRPTAPGPWGVYAGHLGTPGKRVEFGCVKFWRYS